MSGQYQELVSILSRESLFKQFTGKELFHYLQEVFEIKNETFSHHSQALIFLSKTDDNVGWDKKRWQQFQELLSCAAIAKNNSNFTFQLSSNDFDYGADISINSQPYQIVSVANGKEEKYNAEYLEEHGHAFIFPSYFYEKSNKGRVWGNRGSSVLESQELVSIVAKSICDAYQKKVSKAYPDEMGLVIHCNHNYYASLLYEDEIQKLQDLVRDFLINHERFKSLYVSAYPKNDFDGLLYERHGE